MYSIKLLQNANELMINDKNRLEDLNSYRILDTSPEEELDLITELATLICGTPISLLTLLDDKRQWFKSKKGLAKKQTDIKQAFCRFALENPNEVFVVNDSLEDERFKNNELVLNDPNIRFYAGAPLESSRGNVLGTLCIIDTKPRTITENQKRALQILAKKAMGHLELRKILIHKNETIAMGANRLNKLTQNVPSGIFQIRVQPDLAFKFEFISEGIKNFHADLSIEKWLNDPHIVFSLIHPDDVMELKLQVSKAVTANINLYHEYRVLKDNKIYWHSIKAHPEKTNDGDTILYGVFNDITDHYEYELAMEQISFDISHKLRKPVTNLLGLTNLAESNNKATKKELKEYMSYIQIASDELDKYTKQLNETYQSKKRKFNS
ncbi:GAF domain-containing protein [Mesonia aestuariivivens]|uniref:GAF domain-containing protein n=1 Tax=Mesonia aestuariivivens TaxID=2796128 RepID=A0ABS6W4R4_9FLAO|nr:GAF domain-containing protein [Mesonia aestuariivivens]MBW2962845.1 GAF domain-containing protein [Mesonia aestuariivivens]